jgi:ketosteroid isomerase-like protein
MQTATRHAGDEAKIHELLDAYTAAIRARDAAATVACYSRDVVAYDLAPPLSIDAAVERDPSHVQQWFDTWQSPIESTARDVEIEIGDGIAYAFCLRHMTGTKKGGQSVDLWFRATACFRREGGKWKITHVHNSVPFAMDGSYRALVDLKPERA